MTFAIINDHTIHYQYLKTNAVRTFVFVNSLGADFRIWDEVVEILKNHGSVLRFDKPGHGLSEVPQNARSISDYAADVIGLLDALTIQKCVFVGLSIGGIIGQRLAVLHPDRIEKLVLSNTAPKVGTADNWNARIEIVQEQGMSAITEGVLQRWFPTHFQNEHPTELTGYRRMIEQTSPVGYVRACEAIRDEDLTNQITAIRVPTLCIGGTNDIAIPPDLIQAMAATIPNARFELIDGAGHIPCAQMPKTVARLILDFVLESSSSSQAQEPLSLYEQGMKTRRAVLGDTHVNRSEASKTDLDVDFQRYITESAWGMVWSRPGLTRRERSLITIALLATLGHEEELKMHIRATGNTGASRDDVKETLLHTAVYAGVPVANGALKIAKEVFADKES